MTKLGEAGDRFGDCYFVNRDPEEVDAMNLQTQNSPDLTRKFRSLLITGCSVGGAENLSLRKIECSHLQTAWIPMHLGQDWLPQRWPKASHSVALIS